MVYIVKGFLYRNSEFKEENLIVINKEFRNKDKHKAREDAFSYFRSIIEVLLESKNINYENHLQAEEVIKDFYLSETTEQHLKLSFVSYDNDADKILTISFTTDTEPYITKTGIKIYDNEYVIKAIGHQSELLSSRIKKNLEIEKQLLKN